MPQVELPTDIAANSYAGNPSISGPGSKSVDIDAEVSNTEKLSATCRAIRADMGGTMKFHVVGDDESTFRTVTLADGEKYDLHYIDQVWDTGTSATGLLGAI